MLASICKPNNVSVSASGKRQNHVLFAHDFISELGYRRTMSLFSKPSVDNRQKSCSGVISLPAAWRCSGGCVKVCVGWYHVGMLIDNLTPHRESNTLKRDCYATVAPLRSTFCDKVHSTVKAVFQLKATQDWFRNREMKARYEYGSEVYVKWMHKVFKLGTWHQYWCFCKWLAVFLVHLFKAATSHKNQYELGKIYLAFLNNIKVISTIWPYPLSVNP